MYLEYFGLNEAPFSIAPDPRYLYMSKGHREALAHLLYGIGNDAGFVLLTGEVGAGKTTVCRCLLAQIPQEVETAFILNPRLTVEELLAEICDEFGIACPEGNGSVKVFVDRLNRFLLDAHSSGKRAVVIIEEAQNLGADVLEQLRLLTNLETDRQKLLQIILLGQPELREMLERPELLQLSQRITARFHLAPLSRRELPAYVKHRLSVAGCREELIPSSLMRRLFRLSGGIPRVINVICDRALLGVFVREEKKVSGRILVTAAREVLGRPAGQQKRNLPGWVMASAFMFGCGILISSAYYHFRAAGVTPETKAETVRSDAGRPADSRPVTDAILPILSLQYPYRDASAAGRDFQGLQDGSGRQEGSNAGTGLSTSGGGDRKQQQTRIYTPSAENVQATEARTAVAEKSDEDSKGKENVVHP